MWLISGRFVGLPFPSRIMSLRFLARNKVSWFMWLFIVNLILWFIGSLDPCFIVASSTHIFQFRVLAWRVLESIYVSLYPALITWQLTTTARNSLVKSKGTASGGAAAYKIMKASVSWYFLVGIFRERKGRYIYYSSYIRKRDWQIVWHTINF